MLKGIGVDIIEVDRVEGVIERRGDRFLDRIYTVKEIDYCRSKKDYVRSFAGRFAAKEAVMKALGTGWRKGVRWKDIEITNAPSGKPQLTLYGRAREIMDELGAASALVAISHSRDYAVSNAVIF